MQLNELHLDLGPIHLGKHKKVEPIIAPATVESATPASRAFEPTSIQTPLHVEHPDVTTLTDIFDVKGVGYTSEKFTGQKFGRKFYRIEKTPPSTQEDIPQA